MDPGNKCVKLIEWYSLCVTCMKFFITPFMLWSSPVYWLLMGCILDCTLQIQRHIYCFRGTPFCIFCTHFIPVFLFDAMPRTAVHRFPRHVQWCTCFVQCLIQYIQDVVPVFLLGSMDYNSRSGDTSFTYTIWYVKCIRFAFVICHGEIDSGTAECKFESDIMYNLIYKSQPDELW